VLYANTPIESINQELISLTDKDTLDIPFSIGLDKALNEAELIFEKAEKHSGNAPGGDNRFCW